MKLLTKELEKRFAQLGDQDVPDPIVVTKFFHPFLNWTWYATAYYSRDQRFFGWVDSDFPELGYFSLKELESIEIGGLKIERDLYWTECRLSEVKKQCIW